MFLRKTFLKILPQLMFVLACMAPLPTLAEPLYRMTLLPQDFTAAALNRAGLVVGSAQGGAAIWSPTATTYLGALLPGSQGLAINGSGAITGIAGDGAFIYANGALTTFGLPPSTWATAINDAGQVAGFTSEAFGIRSAFIYADGSYTDLPSFGGEVSVANAINAGGQVAGYASVAAGGDDWPDPQRYAALYDDDGQGRNLGSLGGLVSEANDVNDNGFATGWSLLADGIGERPFLFSPLADGLLDLGTLGGVVARANALNNAGSVVGLSDIGGADGFEYHAFVYGAGGMADLNTLVGGLGDWRLTTATDINDAGQILAEACRNGVDECRAVRLDLVTPVPEPGAWALMAAGLAALLWHARRRARPAVLPTAPPGAAPPAARKRAPLAAAALGAVLAGGPAAAAAGVDAAQTSAAAGMDAAPAIVASPAAVPGLQQAPGTGNPGRFRVTFLPPALVASAINSRGQVAGYNGSAAIWDGTTLRDYATLAPGSAAYGINDHGYLAGGYLSAAHVFSPTGLRNAARQILQGSSYAIALNDSGGLAGGSYFGVGERSRGFVLISGVLRMIPSLGGDWSSAAAINRRGQVTGTAALEGDAIPEAYRHAFIFRDKTILDLGTLGGRNSSANDINDGGQVVGGAETGARDEFDNPVLRPFLYSGGAMRDLSVLGGGPDLVYGVANGLNNQGTVVGEFLAETPNGPASRAFLVEGGRWRDLNELTTLPAGWALTWARDINDARQVLAQACGPQSCLYVRLDPVP
jgi:probable HAF family extracellular repeat protein